ncbi:MAG: hypothetical protein ACRDGQ_02905 [Candidatus Limnocylindrales bacterium]
MTESWECPNCQTLNITSTHCYGCGAVRPGWVAPPPEAIEAARVGTTVAPLLSAPLGASSVESSASSSAGSSAGSSAESLAVDTEPHPCWCHLVKGDHDVRDHPASAIERSYDSSDGGEQDYEEDAMLLEDHGYSKSVQRHHHQIDVTYMTDAGAKGPGSWSP